MIYNNDFVVFSVVVWYITLFMCVCCDRGEIFPEFKTCTLPAHPRWLRILSLLWEKGLSHGKAKCRGEIFPSGLFPLWILQYHFEAGYVILTSFDFIVYSLKWSTESECRWIVSGPWFQSWLCVGWSKNL